MPQSRITITNLGTIAQQILAQAQKGCVWGITSQGIYLHFQPGWVVFLSYEPYRGPLTLNICEETAPLYGLKPGLPVTVCNGNLDFDLPGLSICTEGATLWTVPPQVKVVSDCLAMHKLRLESIYQQIRTNPNLPGWLLKLDVYNPREQSSIIFTLEGLMGLGPGLTPAGDDVVLGYLLALNRWGTLLNPDLELQEINPALRQAAYRKTSTLSANLIECATLGLADERLILALDGILTGEPDPDTCIACLSGWGNSSGVSALVGMALALGTRRNLT